MSTIKNTEASLEACYALMDLMAAEPDQLSAFNVDSLIYWSIEHRPFNPSYNTFMEVVQTGDIHLIRNKALKNRLFEWSRSLEKQIRILRKSSLRSWKKVSSAGRVGGNNRTKKYGIHKNAVGAIPVSPEIGIIHK